MKTTSIDGKTIFHEIGTPVLMTFVSRSPIGFYTVLIYSGYILEDAKKFGLLKRKDIS